VDSVEAAAVDVAAIAVETVVDAAAAASVVAVVAIAVETAAGTVGNRYQLLELLKIRPSQEGLFLLLFLNDQ
jgi:hypothetical protein